MQLLWKPITESLGQNIKKYISDNNITDWYIVDFCLNKNDDSAKYVEMKWKYWEKVWIKMIWKYEYKDLQYIYDQIDIYNNDPKCLGMLFQMPLPDELKPSQKEILEHININKDIDWLQYPQSIVLPATAAAVINIFDYYNIDIVNKKILVIWQSNIVGKPLADELEKKWAYIYRADINTTVGEMGKWCQISDIIISATGDLQFLDDKYIYSDNKQVLIDVWFGIKGGKIVGDINFDKINMTNKIYTPVPWWVWPVTIASLFENIVKINSK